MAGLAVFITALATAQLTMFFMGREVDRQSEAVAAVYLDSLSTAAVQALDTGDFAALQQALERTLGFQVGAVDRIIVVGRPDGSVLARVGAEDAEPPMARGELGSEWEPSQDGRVAWAQRPVVESGEVVALVAVQLLFPGVVERRQSLRVRLAVACLLLAAMAAILASSLAERLMRPILGVARALEQIAAHGTPLQPTETERQTEAGRLSSALERLLARLREREELAARLAERERVAVLGRLAATIAHEVRNPVAGMLTAIETLRLFGRDEAVRTSSLDLLERGLRQIEAVVRTTLATQRRRDGVRSISAADLDDLRLLVQPEARRRAVTLDWRVDLQAPFPADAVQLRQVVLNLLLNGIAASPAEGSIVLSVCRRDKHLEVQIEDQAGGLPEAAARRLRERPDDAGGVETMPHPGDGLGLEVAARLTTALGGTILVEALPRGSRISILIPPPPEAAS
ncbi:sensor histidine kinase [Pseudoroseomonas globiformis]|uniref:histidine kinase n=1 Tax=Teichococcus globiformis TaxID=2307229 RepID=A0ABV7G3J6_9PROT